MSKIFIMRHADAKSIKNFNSDAERPLSKKGWAELETIKPLIQKTFRDVSLVLCSPSVRTRETLEGILDILPKSIDIHYLSTLYHAPADIILEEINLYRGDCHGLLLIAHNPGVTDFLETVAQRDFIGGYGEVSLTMPTSGVVTYHYEKQRLETLNFKDFGVESIFKV